MSVLSMIGSYREVISSVRRIVLAAILATASCPILAQDIPAAYTVGPEDVVNVVVARHPELSGEYYVPNDGNVTLPAAGMIEMSGKTLAQIAQNVNDRLHARLRSPEVTVTLKTPRKQQVYVIGVVAKPGLYEMKPDWRCSEAIAAAGGLAPDILPDACRASVRRAATGRSEPIDLAAILRQGSTELGPFMQSGDTLLIDGPETMPVYVTGRVKNPGLYKVRKDKATIVEALAVAGGQLDNSALSRVNVTHTSGSTDTYDLTASLRTGQVDTKMTLQPMDVVLVPEESSRIAVLGYVNEPGFFQLNGAQAMTLIDAISQAKGTSKKANIGAVALVRTDNGTQQRLVYNINKFLRSGDVSQNPTVKAGDVIYVAGSSKLDWNEVLGSAATIALAINPFLH